MERNSRQVGSFVRSDCPLANDILNEGSNVPMDLTQAFLLPDWYDGNKFQRGQRFFHYNYYALIVTFLCGMILVLVVPTVLEVLVLTGQSSTPLTAYKRYLDSMTHMLEWFDGDLLNPNSRACKSLINTRRRHSHASNKASKAGYGRISQRDMALTQFVFVGFILLRQRELGVQGSEEDLEAFIHYWRVIGHLLGIQDKYNLCRGDLATTRAACQVMLDQVYSKHLQNPPPDFDFMARQMLEGIWVINPTIDADASLMFTKMLCNVPFDSPASLYSRLLFKVQVYTHSVMLNSAFSFIIRPMLNFNLWFIFWQAKKFPYLAFFAFGSKALSPQKKTFI